MQFNRSKDLSETMISEMPGPNSQWIQQIPSSSSSVIPKEEVPMQKNINCNVSVSTGEEFSLEFLQDRSGSRVTPAIPGIVKDHGNIGQMVDLHSNINRYHQQGYEDLSSVLGLRRMDSECGSDGTEYASAKGSIENGIYDNNGSWHGMKKTTKVICHDQSSLGSTAPHFTESEIAHSSQTSGVVSDGSQSGKIKFLCSFGGKILSRPSDGKLRYVGGDTRMISISKKISWEELLKKTSEICNQPHTIKYQLPDEDLDALISVSSDEDLQNMIEEYYSIEKRGGSQRLRIFLVPLLESENSFSMNPSIIQQGDPDYQYFVAVNGGSGVDSNVQDYYNGQPLASEISPLGGLGILNPTPLTNELIDIIMPAKQSVPISPMIMQEADLKNDHTRLQKDKSSCRSIEGPHSFSTAQLEPEASRGNLTSYSQIPQVPIDFLKLHDNESKDDTIQKRELNESVPPVYDYSREMLNSPVPEPNVCNFQEFDFGRPVVEGRAFHSESPFLGSNDSVGLFHEMPHAFSDSKLNEYGGSSAYCSQDGISPSFSWNLAPPKVPVSADLQEKLVPQHENVDIFNPQLQANFLNVDQVVSNQGVDFINFPSDPVSGKKIDPRPCDINGNDEKHQLGQAKSNIYSLMTENQEENCPRSKLLNDNHGYFSPAASPEIFNILPNFQPDQASHVVGNNQKQNIHSSGKTIPASSAVVLKPTVEVTMENNPGAEPENNTYCTKNLETVGTLDHSVGKTRDSNCLIDLVSEFSNGFVSHESSVQQPTAVVGNAGHNMRAQIPDLQNQNQNAALRREYSLLDDDFISNVDQNVPRWADSKYDNQKQNTEDVSFGQFQDKSAAINEVWHSPQAESFSATVHRQVDTVQTEYPSRSATKAESAPQDLDSENENFNDGSKNESITDAMMAEMEADVYGLQIIKNVDLEELRELGSGTYGTVYHGRWRGTDVAIKRIRKACFSGRSSEQERLMQDFWKEARILSNLHHPNVVAFYGVVPDGAGGTMATVTEYMANGSLRSVLLKKDRLLDRRRKLIIAMDAAFGMEYLHAKNIIHFDLKCDNLLVNLRDPQRPVCKVGDFGLSKIKRNTLVSGGVRGTLPWMAPELLNGGSNLVSDKVDVFSFGIVMWEILTGDEPYANMHCGAIIGGIVKNSLRPLVPEGCDSEWKKLMEQCWSNNPEQRPSFTDITNRLRSMSTALQTKDNNNNLSRQMPNIERKHTPSFLDERK